MGRPHRAVPLVQHERGRLGKLNHLRESRLYRWLVRLRKEEPGRFPRRNAAMANRLEITGGGIANAKSIVPAINGSSPMAPAASAITQPRMRQRRAS